MSNDILEKLTTSFECKQGAVRAVRFSGERYLVIRRTSP